MFVGLWYLYICKHPYTSLIRDLLKEVGNGQYNEDAAITGLE